MWRARSSCRFPPPWTVEENNNACFIVRDKNRLALGYFYFEDEPGQALGGQTAHQGRGETAGGQLRQAAGFVAQSNNVRVMANTRDQS
jgi:hypothetical protein